MNIALYHVDAFTDKLFSGNPAAVCVLPAWISEEKLRLIAIENNLPVTAPTDILNPIDGLVEPPKIAR